MRWSRSDSVAFVGTAIAQTVGWPCRCPRMLEVMSGASVTTREFALYSMQYDDAARRYNFLAGLGIGAALGVGLAMLALPQKKVLRRRIERVRRGGSRLPDWARSGSGRERGQRGKGERGARMKEV